MVNSLFDSKRRRQIRSALRQGHAKPQKGPERTPLEEPPQAPRREPKAADDSAKRLEDAYTQALFDALEGRLPLTREAVNRVALKDWDGTTPEHSESSVGVISKHFQNEEEELATDALFRAIKEHNIPMVRLAIERGADISYKGMYAPAHKSRDAVEFKSVTPVKYALKEGHWDIMGLLVQKGATE